MLHRQLFSLLDVRIPVVIHFSKRWKFALNFLRTSGKYYSFKLKKIVEKLLKAVWVSMEVVTEFQLTLSELLQKRKNYFAKNP
jgi:hypothetical protein